MIEHLPGIRPFAIMPHLAALTLACLLTLGVMR